MVRRGRSYPGTQEEFLEGVVRELLRGGDVVVDTPRGNVVVAGGLPGERVRIHRIVEGRDRLRGVLAEVLDPSPDRVTPPCPVADACGGCPWMHIAIEAQRAQKVAWAGAATGLRPNLVECGTPLAYRRRTRVRFSIDGAARLLGYRAGRSHRIVDAPCCAVLVPALDTVIHVLRGELLPVLAGEGEILLALGPHGRPVAVVRAAEAQPEGAYRAAERLVRGGSLAGATLRVQGAGADANFGDSGERCEAIDGLELRAPRGGFSQANREVNDALVRRVAALAEPASSNVLELFAGSGNFTVALARNAGSFTAVETDPAACEALRLNLAARGLERVRVVPGDAAAAAAQHSADLVVLDPPRTGAREVARALAARPPKRVVYVSCDPVTLGRDLEILSESGLVVETAEIFDMFPQTTHVETLVRLGRTRR